jgi:hypothetical protein
LRRGRNFVRGDIALALGVSLEGPKEVPKDAPQDIDVISIHDTDIFKKKIRYLGNKFTLTPGGRQVILPHKLTLF